MNTNRLALLGAAGLGLSLLYAPLSSASDPDELTKAVRDKINELRSTDSAPPRSESETLPPALEAQLLAALRKSMAELHAAAAPEEQRFTATPRPAPAAKAGMNMAPNPRPPSVAPMIAKAAPPTAPAPAPTVLSSDPAERLRALTELYKANQISPRSYHLQRSQLVVRK